MSDEAVLLEARAIVEADERSPAAPGSHGASRARLARALLSREADVRNLRERLEVDHCWEWIDGKMARVPVPEGEAIPDGIECREETIKWQDGYIDELQRRLRSREAERDAMRREIDDLREFIRGVGVNCLRAAGQPSADGGKEGK